MKATELRIGNWISAIYEHEIDRGDGIVEDVESSHVVQFIGYDPFSNYMWTEGGFRDEYREFNPIPLTEEWLERFGFASIVFTVNHSRKVKDDYRKESNGYFVKLSKGLNNPDTFYYFPSNVGKGLPVKYVHQLQNLYFALTGEELTINQ